MMRTILVAILAVALFLGTGAIPGEHTCQAVAADATAAVHGEYLRTMLTKGLLVTRDEQRAFIGNVVQAVEEGKLPVKVVYAAFDWARKRRREYPFPYFVYAVRALAKQYNVPL